MLKVGRRLIGNYCEVAGFGTVFLPRSGSLNLWTVSTDLLYSTTQSSSCTTSPLPPGMRFGCSGTAGSPGRLRCSCSTNGSTSCTSSVPPRATSRCQMLYVLRSYSLPLDLPDSVLPCHRIIRGKPTLPPVVSSTSPAHVYRSCAALVKATLMWEALLFMTWAGELCPSSEDL